MLTKQEGLCIIKPTQKKKKQSTKDKRSKAQKIKAERRIEDFNNFLYMRSLLSVVVKNR